MDEPRDYGHFVREAPDGLSLEEFWEWNRARRHADGPMVKRGDGHREIIATNSMDPDHAHELVQSARRESKRLMAERERGIDAGMVHQTPAWESMAKKYGG